MNDSDNFSQSVSNRESHITAPGANPASVQPPPRVGRIRWTMCALLFFATTINYMDRQVLALVKQNLEADFGMTNEQYGLLNSAFTLTYGFGMLFVGRILDKMGTRIGFGIAVALWSLAGMCHAFVGSIAGLAICRGMLGLAEAANFPGSVKAVGEWFPKKERALATGIFNAGSNVALTIAPWLIPFIAIAYGWRATFLVTGLFGFVWLIFWFWKYRTPEQHPTVQPAELEYIRSDMEPQVKSVSWSKVIGMRQTWVFIVGKMMSDPIWWFFMAWLPDFYKKAFEIDIKSSWPMLIAIYLIADFGSIGGGWLSGRLLRTGRSLNFCRKITMLICAALVLPVIFAPHLSNIWLGVLLIGLAAAAHQGWMANLFTLVSDTFPRSAVGTVVGIGGMAGALTGALLQWIVGIVLDDKGSAGYVYIFTGASFAYLIALTIMHLLNPRHDPAPLQEIASTPS